MAFFCSSGFADLLGEGAFDTINIRADEAVEDEAPDIIHLKGNFQMLSHEWRVTSNMATVHGNPNKPDRIYLQGSPARFLFLPEQDTSKEPIEAQALNVEYLRDTNSLKLTGDATLMLGNEIIRSSYIEYDITTNHYQAGGDNGVIMKVPPVD